MTDVLTTDNTLDLPLPPSHSGEYASLDDLADQSTTDPIAFAHLMQTLQPRLATFTRLAQVDTSIASDVEVQRVKTHLSKLKLGYLHLQTKHSFLTRIAQAGLTTVDDEGKIPIHVDEAEIRNVEAEIASNKAAVKALEDECTDIQTRLKVRVNEFAHQWTELTSSTAAFIDQYDARTAYKLKRQIAECGFDNYDDGLDLEIVQSRYESAVDQAKQLDDEVAASEVAISQSQLRQEQMQAEIDRLTSEIKANEERNQAEINRINAETEWLRAMNQATTAVTGFQVISVQQNNKAQCRITTNASTNKEQPAQRSECVNISVSYKVEADGAYVITSIDLIDSTFSFTAAAIDRYRSMAITTNDLAYFVASVQGIILGEVE